MTPFRQLPILTRPTAEPRIPQLHARALLEPSTWRGPKRKAAKSLQLAAEPLPPLHTGAELLRPSLRSSWGAAPPSRSAVLRRPATRPRSSPPAPSTPGASRSPEGTHSSVVLRPAHPVPRTHAAPPPAGRLPPSPGLAVAPFRLAPPAGRTSITARYEAWLRRPGGQSKARGLELHRVGFLRAWCTVGAWAARPAPPPGTTESEGRLDPHFAEPAGCEVGAVRPFHRP